MFGSPKSGDFGMSNVLIVDTQELFRASLVALFERDGLKVCHAGTAARGDRGCSTVAVIDLIVMDVDLRHFHLWVWRCLAAACRASRVECDSRVIVLTSLVDKACIVRREESGRARELSSETNAYQRSGLLDRVRAIPGFSVTASGAQQSARKPPSETA